MGIGENIKRLREEYKLSQAELGRIAGVSDKAVSTWENGLKIPRMGAIQKIADHFGITKSDIIEDTGVGGQSALYVIPPGYEPLPDMSRVPRVGRIACGQPILAEENIEDYDSIPSSWRADFTLICVGDSMSPRILDGDMVAIHKQPCVENGQIAVVRIENEATLKRVYLYPDRMVLQPENQAYAPIVLVGEEMNTVSIEGKAVGLCRVIV